jgi:putative ABC transport system permease protein
MSPQSEVELVNVSAVEIAISMIPLMAVAWASSCMGLDIESPILVGTARTFIQLSILGFILDPIFVWGVDLWWVVLGYCCLMIVLASYEASVRSRYYLEGQFWMVLAPMTVMIFAVGGFAFCVVLQPEPRWDPQYVIPIVGMLLGNCINGISLAMNSILTSFVESSREIELLLSFGANSYEATSRLFREAVRTGAMPQLNGMAIIGIISIPGMMTGQILGGTTVMQAARYQILITYYIALCSFGTTLMMMFLTLQVCFDSRTVLRTDLLHKREKKPTFLDLVKSIFVRIGSICRSGKRHANDWRSHSISITAASDELTFLISPKKGLSVSSAMRTNIKSPVMRVENLSYGFDSMVDDEGAAGTSKNGSDPQFRILFENVSFDLFPGGTAFVSGPSGVGKSSVLRILAGLTVADSDGITLSGKSQKSYVNVSLWRSQIRYVPQTKVDIPGTPMDLMVKISSFKVWKMPMEGEALSLSQLSCASKDLIRSWGMNTNLLDSDWKILSGGES